MNKISYTGYSGAVELDRVEQPRVFLVFAMKFAGLSDVVPHRLVGDREPVDGVETTFVSEVPHHILAVLDGFDRSQEPMEKRRGCIPVCQG